MQHDTRIYRRGTTAAQMRSHDDDLPSGYVYLTDDDDVFLTDSDGAYLVDVE